MDFDFIVFLLACVFMLFFGFIVGFSYSDIYNETECVEFYRKNNYVLDSCEIYRDKLEDIKK